LFLKTQFENHLFKMNMTGRQIDIPRDEEIPPFALAPQSSLLRDCRNLLLHRFHRDQIRGGVIKNWMVPDEQRCIKYLQLRNYLSETESSKMVFMGFSLNGRYGIFHKHEEYHDNGCYEFSICVRALHGNSSKEQVTVTVSVRWTYTPAIRVIQFPQFPGLLVVALGSSKSRNPVEVIIMHVPFLDQAAMSKMYGYKVKWMDVMVLDEISLWLDNMFFIVDKWLHIISSLGLISFNITEWLDPLSDGRDNTEPEDCYAYTLYGQWVTDNYQRTSEITRKAWFRFYDFTSRVHVWVFQHFGNFQYIADYACHPIVKGLEKTKINLALHVAYYVMRSPVVVTFILEYNETTFELTILKSCVEKAFSKLEDSSDECAMCGIMAQERRDYPLCSTVTGLHIHNESVLTGLSLSRVVDWSGYVCMTL
ncbi:hypothetical protein T03_5340, partial [Trichinella britovi]